MKLLKTTLLLGLILILVYSFRLHRLQSDNEKMIIGIWVFHNHENQISAYKKKKKFDNKEGGIEFKENGLLIKRQNSGWCGTPPIDYGNFDGTWESTSDSTLTIRYKYWGGEAEQDLLIKKLTKTELHFKTLEYRTEEK